MIRLIAGCSRLCVGLVTVLGVGILVITPDEPPLPMLEEHQKPVVVIDAGHGGVDDGAKGRGLVEKELTLDLALRLDQILRKRGFPTVLTRKEDRFVPLPVRAAVANEVKEPAIFISLHFNTGRGKGTNGIETFYASVKRPEDRFNRRGWRWVGFFVSNDSFDSGENLAADVQMGAVARTGARDRGIHPRSLHVTRETRIPAILVEGGFMTDKMESALLQTEAYRQLLAEGIADGVEVWTAHQPRRQSILAGVAHRMKRARQLWKAMDAEAEALAGGAEKETSQAKGDE